MAALWLSKDRFAAKRLRGVADALDPAKRAVIEDKSAFRSLLTVAPFNIPNELIDFVALNTSSQLREFNYRSKRIVFTRDMVRKVFGFRCGDKKVELLKKSAAHELRDVYTSPKGRPDIATCIQVLQSCDVTDEDSILRSWDLLCLATVVDPGSGNNISMEYIASMLDPTKTHEYAWDELVLQLAMMEVTKIQKQYAKPVPIGGVPKFWISGPFALLGIVYMDHLDFPPNEHAINYSLPRACSVTTEDFEFTCANDLDRKILNNSTIFGRRPFRELAATPYGNAIEQPPQPSAEQVQEVEVNPSASLNEWLCFPSSDNLEIPARFKHLYDKHKEIFASDVDASLKTFGAGLKTMQAHRMAALLVDVEASLLVDGDGANVSFPTSDVPEDDQNKSHGAGEEEDEGVDDANMGADFVEPAPNVVAEALDSELVAKKVAESRLTNPASDQVAEGSDSEPATNRYELVARTIAPDVPQPAVVMDSLTNAGDVGDQLVVNSPTRSMWQPSPRKDISDEAWNRAPDAPSMELFTEDSQEHAWLSVLNDKVDDSSSGGKPSSPIPIKDASMDLMTKGVASSNVGGSDKDHPTDTTNKDSEKTGGNDVVVAETSLVEAPSTEANSDEAAVPPSDPGTPVQLVTSEEDAAIGASTGAETLEKKNRFKRACKTELVPPKMKKIKVSQEHIHVYDKYIFHGRKLKRKGKTAIPKPFIKIGRSYCTYKPFYASLRPRQCLDSEVMDVWIEKFNHDAKVLCEKNVRVKKKYAFSMLMTGQLAVDPALFKPSTCMKEFKIACSKFRILRDDLLYLPIVKDEHWIVCCFNIIHKQYHVFDSMMMEGSKSQLEVAANNVFSNFVRTANESGLSNSVDFGTFTRFTPVHPQQQTLFDCGFFSILIMENFNGKAVAEFTNECIPDFRKLLAASLIHGADNEDALEKLLEEELQFS